jgi:hypothetical protein
LTENIQGILEKIKNDPKYFIQTQLYIKTKTRDIVPFKYNEVQNKVYDIIQSLRVENKPVRIIVLKARQTGISTLTEALIYHDTTTNANVTSFIIAHDKESTQHLFSMSKLFYDKSDRDLRPMIHWDNKIELSFQNPSKKTKDDDPGLRSRIRVDTAGNPQAGRSLTLQNLHCSEVGFWENPETVMTGLMQAVPDINNTMIVIESTANGVGNYFHKFWQDAEAGNNDFLSVFIAWFELVSYRMIPPLDFEPYDFEHEIYGNEVKLAELYNLDNQQLYWRRYTIKNKCGNDINQFKQEYPATPTEAFLATGANIFDSFLISKYYKFVTEPKKRGGLDDDLKFTHSGRGELRIWKEPEENNRYSVGADVAEGLVSGDYSCAIVLDKKNYEQVAEWHGKVPPDKFAHILKNLSKYYNNAKLVVESNNHGLTTLSYLKPIYYNLYYRKDIGNREDKMTRQMGFRTTSKSKPVMIDTFAKLFREDEIKINGRELLSEMSTYVEDDNGSMNAQSGCFDDRVIAISLAIVGLKEVYLNVSTGKEEITKHKYSNPYTRY